jgi:hypothetical protein
MFVPVVRHQREGGGLWGVLPNDDVFPTFCTNQKNLPINERERSFDTVKYVHHVCLRTATYGREWNRVRARVRVRVRVRLGLGLRVRVRVSVKG